MPAPFPDCSWRPYAGTSRFNTPIKNPKIAANSAKIMAHLTFAGTNRWSGIVGTDDWWHPIYFASADDPLYTIRFRGRTWSGESTKTWGTNDLEGRKVHLTAKAKPAMAGDGHLGIVQPDGDEVSFWQVGAKAGAGIDHANRIIEASWGGHGPIDGSGITKNPATAAHFGLSAGHVRSVELAAGNVNHALFITTNRVARGPYAPATGNAAIAPDSEQDIWPHTGQALWLDMPWSEIDGLIEPAWLKAIMRPFSLYGALVGDTGGSGGRITIAPESQQAYVSTSGVNPMTDWLKSLGVSSIDIGTRLERYRDRMKWLAAP